MEIPAIPADTSMPSSNDSVISTPNDALELTLVRSTDSGGQGSAIIFNENAVVVQGEGAVSTSNNASHPPSPQRPHNAASISSSPSSAQRGVGIRPPAPSIITTTATAGATTPVSATTPTTPTTRIDDSSQTGNPFETLASQASAASAQAAGNPFDSPTLRYKDSVFQAYDHTSSIATASTPHPHPQHQSQATSTPTQTQPQPNPQHTPVARSHASALQQSTPANPNMSSGYHSDLNPAADGLDEISHGDTVGSTVTSTDGTNTINVHPNVGHSAAGGSLNTNTRPGMVGRIASGNMSANPNGNAVANERRQQQKIAKRLSSRGRSGSLGEDGIPEGVLICGSLQKLGRNGKWQTRWFETDGECLSYYKSSQRMKLLATLDLTKVGSVVIDHADPTGCAFVINIQERPYRLRADGKVTCMDWVITLNRVKEARNQEGNVKLLLPNKRGIHQQPPDLLSDNITPRVVVVANRERTRAVDDINSWEQAAISQSEHSGSTTSYFQGGTAPANSSRLARWQKPRTSMSRFARKVLTWARSLRTLSCTDARSQVMERPTHPPQHSNDQEQDRSNPAVPYSAQPNTKDAAHVAWVGKETSATEMMGISSVLPKDQSVSDSATSGANSNDDVDSDEEPRELS